MKNLNSFLKSPLFLFVFFGVILFLAYSEVTEYVGNKEKTIVIDAGQYQLQKELYLKTWNREPNEDQLQRQIDNYVMDEIFYREGVALGLDKTDMGIKRRVRQMVELMLEDYTTVTPGENQLRTYLNQNPDKFRTEPKMSFQQIYFSTDQRNEAENFLEKLADDASHVNKQPPGLTMIPSEFTEATFSAISRYLGNDFTQALFDSDKEGWYGPVKSPMGYHLIHIDDRIQGEIPDLNEIWTQVEEAWSTEQKLKMKTELYQKLKEQYLIIYDFDDNQ